MSSSYLDNGIPRLAPGLVGMAVGLAGEVIVPWATIWLSDWLVFDVPHWALWPIFGGPIALGLSSALVVRFLQKSTSAQSAEDDWGPLATASSAGERFVQVGQESRLIVMLVALAFSMDGHVRSWGARQGG